MMYHMSPPLAVLAIHARTVQAQQNTRAAAQWLRSHGVSLHAALLILTRTGYRNENH